MRRRHRHPDRIDPPHPSRDEPLGRDLKPEWRHVKPRATSGDELATYEVTLPPGLQESASYNGAAHWLMAYDRLLDLAGRHEVIWWLKQVFLPDDFLDSGAGWCFWNGHNSPHDVGQGPWGGGIGWGFGNGVSALALNLDDTRKLAQHVEQVIDGANGSASKDLALTDWPRGRWATLLGNVRFGRGDGTTPHTGFLRVWVDDGDEPVVDEDPITINQRAQAPDGSWWTQTKLEWWEGGPYVFVGSPGESGPTYVTRQTLTQIGATLADAYADRPQLEKEWGVTYPGPGSSYSTQLAGADARHLSDYVLPQWARDELGLDNGGPPPQPDGDLPGVPANLTAAPDDGAVGLAWDAAPEAEAVDRYQVYLDDEALALDVAEPSYTVGGLSNGIAYSFRVSAHNASGYGDWSEAEIATPSADEPPPTPDDGTQAQLADHEQRLAKLEAQMQAIGHAALGH